MTRGEFQSINAIYNILPEFVLRPIAYSTYRMILDTYFFLYEFREIIDDMPNPRKFAALLLTLHQKSVSPTSKFGFYITTYVGNLPQFVVQEDSQEAFFAKTIRQALNLEVERKGPSKELNTLSSALFGKVILRLLGPLESDGRIVKPSLIYRDLQYVNIGIDIDNDQPLIFDTCYFFTYNECKFSYEALTVAYTKSLKFKR